MVSNLQLLFFIIKVNFHKIFLSNRNIFFNYVYIYFLVHCAMEDIIQSIHSKNNDFMDKLKISTLCLKVYFIPIFTNNLSYNFLIYEYYFFFDLIVLLEHY